MRPVPEVSGYERLSLADRSSRRIERPDTPRAPRRLGARGAPGGLTRPGRVGPSAS